MYTDKKVVHFKVLRILIVTKIFAKIVNVRSQL